MPLPQAAEPSMVLSAQMPLRIIDHVRAVAKTEDRSVSSVMRRIMEDWYEHAPEAGIARAKKNKAAKAGAA
jgi:hypothetical protein